MAYGSYDGTYPNQGGAAHNPNMMMNIGMGMNISPGILGDTFMYHGNSIGFQGRMDSISDTDSYQIKNANISITGQQFKQSNICCMIWTIVCGSIFILPIFFMCCDWWKKIVYPAYEISNNTYQSLQRILSSPNIVSLSLNVNDNRFNAQKASIIYQNLSRSSLRYFSFTNSALNYDFDGREYSDFQKYMKKIKDLPMETYIRWYKIY